MSTSRCGVLLLVSVALVVAVLSVRAGSAVAVKAGSSAAAGQGAAKTGDTAWRPQEGDRHLSRGPPHRLNEPLAVRASFLTDHSMLATLGN
jgi:hypothetical protein